MESRVENNKQTANGVEFFSRVSAMISHELKNSLAIINENTGLLSDLIQMQKNGRPMNTDRLARLSTDLDKQIERSNRIINDLNYFAHSQDIPEVELTLTDIMEKFMQLTNRCCDQHGIDVILEIDELSFKSNPFKLLNLFWYFLQIPIEKGHTDVKLIFRSEIRDGVYNLLARSDMFDREIINKISENKGLIMLAEDLKMEVVPKRDNKEIKIIINNSG